MSCSSRMEAMLALPSGGGRGRVTMYWRSAALKSLTKPSAQATARFPSCKSRPYAVGTAKDTQRARIPSLRGKEHAVWRKWEKGG